MQRGPVRPPRSRPLRSAVRFLKIRVVVGTFFAKHSGASWEEGIVPGIVPGWLNSILGTRLAWQNSGREVIFMPRGDGSGPWGAGPMTGRVAPYCAGYPVPGFVNRGASRALWGARRAYAPMSYAGAPFTFGYAVPPAPLAPLGGAYGAWWLGRGRAGRAGLAGGFGRGFARPWRWGRRSWGRFAYAW